MTPDSPEIKYENVAARRERPVILFPHNRVANSPGNPVWVQKKNLRDCPLAGQMLIGDPDPIEPVARGLPEGG